MVAEARKRTRREHGAAFKAEVVRACAEPGVSVAGVALLHKRYKLRRSTLITSNRILDDWKLFLGDAALTTAILDRLLHRSVLVEFRGRSYRLKHAAERLANNTANA